MAVSLTAGRAGGIEPGIEEIELQLFLEALRRLEDRDYGTFARSVLRRRIAERMRAERAPTITALLERVLHDRPARARLIAALGAGGRRVPFADPSFFATFRTQVVPLLQTYAFVRIWLPEAGTGEDAYALACLLDDAGILERSVLYATSSTEELLEVARHGVYDVGSAGAFGAALTASGFVGGPGAFATVSGSKVTFAPRLREKLMFARHDVARDASINEFHAIVARGVVSRYNGETQYAIQRLFYESLSRLGFLGLGRDERLEGTVHATAFRRVVAGQPIYRRMR